MIKKKCFKRLFKKKYFDKDLLRDTFDNMTALYLKNGYLDFTILRHEISPTKCPDIYTINIFVDEKKQYIFEAIAIPKFTQFENEGPFLTMQNREKPWIYDPLEIETQKEWLLRKLHELGYLYAKVHAELQPHDGKTILVWHIDEKEPILFGKTVIYANSSIPFTSTLQALAYKDNDLWDSKKIRASFIRLKESQLYETISLAPAPWWQENTRPVLLRLQKDDPFELRLRTGIEFQNIRQYQTFGGLAYRIGGTFLVKNLSNHADYVRFDADVARAHREVRLKYFYPWIAQFPFDGLLQAYAVKYDQPGFIGSSTNIYTIFQHGFLGGLRYRNTFFDIGVNMGFEVDRTRIAKDDSKTREEAARVARAIDFNVALLNKRVPFLFVEPTMIINVLDSSLNPSQGTFSLISCKGMFPTDTTFKDTFFVKVLAEHSWFIPMQKVIGAFRIRIGHIFHRLFKDIMPNERFYLGGAHSIRSYESDLAPPLGEFVDQEGKCRIVPRGGKTMFNANAELRIPTFKNTYLVVFQDLGILSGDDFCDFKPDNLAAGTGFGVRYLTPIGPLRFDVAWKWKRHPLDEQRFNWFLTFGQAF